MLLSKKQYADHRKAKGLPGGSAPAVTYAVKDGRILCVDGLIDADQADIDWAKNTSVSQSQSGVKAGAVRAAQIKANGPSPRVNKPEAAPPLVVVSDLPQAVRGDLNASRASKEFYEAELSRLKFEEKEGTLISATIVRAVLYEAGRIIRAGHDDIVAQLAPSLASETAIPGVEKILKLALDKLDNALADRIAKLDTTLLDTQAEYAADEAA